MSDLSSHQNNLQALSDIIRFALGVDVFFVDQRMVAVAGTGPYRTNIGTKRPRDSYVDITLSHGDGQVVTQPRYTRQCYRCEYRGLCPYSMVMCRPVVEGRNIKGLIGFLGFSEEQRKVMIERSLLLTQISQRLDYVWEAEGLDVNSFLTHPGTRRLLDAFDECLVLATPNREVLAMNERAEQLVIPGRIEIPEGPDLSIGLDNTPLNKERRGQGFVIAGENRPAGRLFVVPDEKRDGRFWRGCPLSTPAVTTIVGTSPVMASLKQQAAYVAESDSTVLLTGETGAGKELAARFIHQSSPRWAGPFETVNCAAIPEALFESELFGYAPGAFTGADRKGRPGRFQAADRGTIFLDEVGRLSLANQTKILRILEERQVQRLGDNSKTDIDIRVMAATNVDLEQQVKENQFLPDLYYRLMVIPLTVPPLRERVDDIPLLTEYFILQLRESIPNQGFQGFSKEAMQHIQKYSWPGNVRELKNMVEYVLNLVRGRPVEISDLPPAMQKTTAGKQTPDETLAHAEMEKIRQSIQTYGNSTEGKKKAAKALGISLSTLYRRLGKGGMGSEAGEINVGV